MLYFLLETTLLLQCTPYIEWFLVPPSLPMYYCRNKVLSTNRISNVTSNETECLPSFISILFSGLKFDEHSTNPSFYLISCETSDQHHDTNIKWPDLAVSSVCPRLTSSLPSFLSVFNPFHACPLQIFNSRWVDIDNRAIFTCLSLWGITKDRHWQTSKSLTGMICRNFTTKLLLLPPSTTTLLTVTEAVCLLSVLSKNIIKVNKYTIVWQRTQPKLTMPLQRTHEDRWYQLVSP